MEPRLLFTTAAMLCGLFGSDSCEAQQVARADLKGHRGPVWCVSFDPNTKIGLLASGSADKTVRVWDVAKAKEVLLLKGRGEIHSLAFSPDGLLVAAGSARGAIQLWDIRTGNETFVLTGHVEVVLSLAFTPDGKTLVSGGQDNTIRFWDTSAGNEIGLVRCKPVRETIGITSLTVSPDGATVASAQNDGSIVIWDISTRTDRRRLQGFKRANETLKDFERPVDCVRFSPDGKTLVSTDGGDGERPTSYITVWDVATGKERSRIDLKGEKFDILTLEFLRDGKTLACGFAGGGIRLWDITTGERKAAWKDDLSFVKSVSVSPDGKTLATL